MIDCVKKKQEYCQPPGLWRRTECKARFLQYRFIGRELLGSLGKVQKTVWCCRTHRTAANE